MKYKLVKNIPFNVDGKELMVGDIIDASDKKYEAFNFLNKNLFEPFYESKYEYGQKLIYDDKFYLVIGCDAAKQIYTIQCNNTIPIKITDKTKVTIPTPFWFVDSNGRIQQDYLERPKLDKDGLKFKKDIGNFFLTNEDVSRYRRELLTINKK